MAGEPPENQADGKAFATWCVMTHARPVLVDALRTWGLKDAASAIEKASSLAALRANAAHADVQIRQHIAFTPLRRDLSKAVTTLQAAITFAVRGDAENAAAVVIGVFTNSASAVSWRRPWSRLSWARRRVEVIAQAQREQNDYFQGRAQR